MKTLAQFGSIIALTAGQAMASEVPVMLPRSLSSSIEKTPRLTSNIAERIGDVLFAEPTNESLQQGGASLTPTMSIGSGHSLKLGKNVNYYKDRYVRQVQITLSGENDNGVKLILSREIPAWKNNIYGNSAGMYGENKGQLQIWFRYEHEKIATTLGFSKDPAQGGKISLQASFPIGRK